MTTDANGQSEEANRVLLRWFEDENSAVREEPVELIEARISGPVLRSAFKMNENAKVHLIGKNDAKTGTVRSCRQDGEGFLLTLLMDPEDPEPALTQEYDPGFLVIDDFLSEEEEAKILESLGLDTPQDL